jgi:Protein of unknown function DUF262
MAREEIADLGGVGKAFMASTPSDMLTGLAYFWSKPLSAADEKLTIATFEKEMWGARVRPELLARTDAEINERYRRGEGRIIVENNREKLPTFAEQLKQKSYIDVRPFYQRRPRWDPVKQSRLIESFLINLPVPPVFLYEKDYNSYEVMDGQQRITAIKDFYENKLRLEGLEHWPELDGKIYDELPSLVKAGIDRRSISSIVMLKESAPEDEEAVLLREIVFERLNTGGIQLGRQEIRNALFQGPFNDMLIKMSRKDAIRKAWDLPLYSEEEMSTKPKGLLESPFFSKMEDVEMVLRFFALRNADFYTKGMQPFLDMYMMHAAKFSKQQIEELRSIFEECLSTAKEIFAELLFCPYKVSEGEWGKTPSKGFYDAVMVGLANNKGCLGILEQRREAVIEETKALFKTHEDGAFTGRGNSKKDILNRIHLYSKMLEGVAA